MAQQSSGDYVVNDPPPPYERFPKKDIERAPRVPVVSVSGAASRAPAPVTGSPIWWRRKHFWIPILVGLGVFAIIFGTVFGLTQSKNTRHNHSGSQFQGGSSTTASSTASSTPSPYPETPPRDSVPRDIGMAIGMSFSLLMWDLQPEGKLWRKGTAGTWDEYADRKFLVAPVTVTTGADTQTAFAIDAETHRIVYIKYQNGLWEHENWQEIEMECCSEFYNRPVVLSRAEGQFDVFNIDSEGRVMTIGFDGSSWTDWVELGSDFVGEVAATSWDANRIDIFGTSKANVIHTYWTSDAGWAGEWDDMQDPTSDFVSGEDGRCSPLAVSWRTPEGDGQIDVVIVASGGTRNKLFSNSTWGDWRTVYASHEGIEFPDTQSLIRGDGADDSPFAHLISRGSDDCIHYNRFDGLDWGHWQYMYCAERTGNQGYLTEFLPTVAVRQYDGLIDLVARDEKGDIVRYEFRGAVRDDAEWSPDYWESWGHGG